VAVFSVPLLDRAGTEIERHLLVLGGEAAGPRATGAGLAALTSAARRVAHARLDARRRRLRRLVCAAAVLAAAHEQAIVAHLHAVRCPEQAQPSLFGRRAARAFDTARAATTRPADSSHLGLRPHASADVIIGEPVLELLFTPR
jgi:hypothetical protein